MKFKVQVEYWVTVDMTSDDLALARKTIPVWNASRPGRDLWLNDMIVQRINGGSRIGGGSSSVLLNPQQVAINFGVQAVERFNIKTAAGAEKIVRTAVEFCFSELRALLDK